MKPRINKRIIYRDEKNLSIYASIPAEQFKDFFMAYLTYESGDNVDELVKDPMTAALLKTYIPKIEENETKWLNKATQAQENGKKGGRPKKGENKGENTPSNTNPHTTQESVLNQKCIGKNEVLQSGSTKSKQINLSEKEKDMVNLLPRDIKVDIITILSDFGTPLEEKMDEIEGIASDYLAHKYDMSERYDLYNNIINQLAA